MSLLNSSSMASLWSMINQLQLLFLLFLTNSFIPVDVQITITGPDFALNVASYFGITNIAVFDSTIGTFDFNLSYQSLDLLNIKSDSSIFNVSPVIIVALMVAPLHLLVAIVYKCTPAEVTTTK